MPEAQTQVVPNQFKNLPMQQLIDLRASYDDARKINAVKDKEWKALVAEIDHVLLDYHEENPEVLQLAGSQHKIGFSEETTFSPLSGERENFLQWCFNNDALHLLTWHVNNAAARSQVLLQPELPHTSSFVKKKITMRKA